MAGVFMRLTGGGFSYLASVDATGVHEKPAKPSGPEIAKVSRVQLIDPNTNGLLLDTAVIVGSCRRGDEDKPLWRELEFDVRCFLQPEKDGRDQAADVQLKLVRQGGRIGIEDYEVFGDSARGVDFGPRPDLSTLPSMKFRTDVLTGETPRAVFALGLTMKDGVLIDTVHDPDSKGYEFSLGLKMPDEGQSLTAFKLPITRKEIPTIENLLRVAHRPAPGTTPDSRPVSWQLDVFHIPSSDVQHAWNTHIARPLLDGLSTIRSGVPVSFIPTLEIAGGVWRAFYKISDIPTRNPKVIVRDAEDLPHRDGVTLMAATLEPVPRDGKAINASATLPNLLTREGDPLKLDLVLDTPLERIDKRGFSMAVKATPKGTGSRVRMGALDLVFGDAIPGAATLLQASFRPTQRMPPTSNEASVPGLPRFERCELDLSVARIAPAAQDEIPGTEYLADRLIASDPDRRVPLDPEEARYLSQFERESALVVPGQEDDNAYGFRLEVLERAAEGQSHTIELRLERPSVPPEIGPGARTDLDLLVVDRHPFSVAKVQVPSYLAALADATSSEIGNWTNRATDLGWELLAGASGFELVLPPQGVGEDMHRRKSDDDVLPGRRIKYRFSPPTRARLRSSYHRQRFVEAPWNLRRVLGHPGQRDPGAGVDELEFELLYGLSGQIRAQALRLSEIGAELGMLPGTQRRSPDWSALSIDQRKAFEHARTAWGHLYRVLQSRLGILELRNTRAARTTLSERDGLNFVLRETADLRYPIVNELPPRPEIPKGALTGSYAWAFESKRLYDALWRVPRSTSAELASPMFSALGGYGQQVARFDNNRAAVIASVRMGRVESLTIERVGYIGILRNKAKHVITYIRTVAPSLQFKADQRAFEGVPLLRKVREYVELLEPTRPFDQSGTEGDRGGFVRESAFHDGDPPQIPIDSRWGEDHGEYGWRIPLWRTGLSDAVYPKPRISLLVDADRAGLRQHAFIEDPQKLYFYTTVHPDLSADTDTWPMVEGIDFAALIKGDHDVRQTSDDQVKQATANARGDAKDFGSRDNPYAPELGPFTLTLAPTSRPINVMAERLNEPVAAVLHSVTLMRGLTKEIEAAPAGAAAELRKWSGRLDNAVRSVINELPPAASAASLKKQLLETEASVSQQLADLRQRVSTLQAPPGTTICATFTESLQRRLDVFRVAIEQQVGAQLQALDRDLIATLRPLGEDLAMVRSEATKRTQAFFSQASQTVQFGGSALKAGLADASAAITEAGKAIRGVLDNVRTVLAGASLSAAEARKQVRRAAETANEQLHAVSTAFEERAAALIGNRADKVRAAIGGVRAAVRSAADATIRELDRLEQAGASITAIRDEALEAVDAVQTQLAQFEAAILMIRVDIENALGGFTTDLERRLKNYEDEAVAAIAAAADWKALEARLAEARATVVGDVDAAVHAHLASIQTWVDKQASALCAALAAPYDQLRAAAAAWLNADAYAAELSRMIENGVADVRAELEKFLDERQRELAGVEAEARKLLQQAKMDLPIAESSNAALQLLRAFGEPPRVPDLTFTPEQRTAFRYAQLAAEGLAQLPEVGLTPLVAKARELVEGANQLAIRVPAVKLAERLIPPALQHFDLNSVLPKIAGLDLSSLFSQVKLPTGASDQVRVTHGVNPEAMAAWLQADFDIPFNDKPADVFSIAGITLTVKRARFTGSARFEAARNEAPRQRMHGELAGDWDVSVGGYPVVVLTNCTLSFDNEGHFHFDVSPERVRLQAALEFVADALASFNSEGRGFSTAITPQGLVVALDLAIPDVQAGSFGISNVSLALQFAVDITPFQLRLLLAVARRRRPFTLTVFILGGAGFFEFEMTYQPMSRMLESRLAIGIFASASLAIALGPINGGVYAYFGITVDHTTRTGRAAELRVAIVLFFGGQVSLLGFITVSLQLGLQAEYRSGGGLVGRGWVSYSIKIGPFFSIDVTCAVEYNYGNPAVLPDGRDDYRRAARRYLNAFAN